MSDDIFEGRVKEALIKYSNMNMTDKASYHALEHFYPTFLKYLLSKNEEDISILEVGVAQGGSMSAWMEIFPKAKFYGIDWNLSQMKDFVKKDDRLVVVQMSQSDEQIKDLFPGVSFDLIIDDASHQSRDQQITFNLLKNRLTSIGKYVIEDVYPENIYPKEFTDQFKFVDITHIKNRGDDRLYIYPAF